MDKILILAGGYSNEKEISLITAASVTKELKKNKNFKLLTIEPSEGAPDSDFENLIYFSRGRQGP